MGELREIRRIAADLTRWKIKLNDAELLNHAG